MKGYLLLENGSLFEGKIISQTKNILGNVLLDYKGTIKLECQKTGKCGLITNTSNDKAADILLSDINFQSLKSMIEKNNMLQGKIVTDSLPIEYHMYDLKTFIPV
ncbi:hypothetical protein [Paramaledivibacter caminithermalis]|uniref:Uncharacterized protein n=1 Tax=Paramaledivibacter caminithermalis (strain DSM 15212 / CIP 107654 / DViRD3) TaxID=1121301 RepID=A0A1M6K1Q3_PARC5|nr:hypothetical protein [Paramaledivibacter caminithermalis]SHJ52906.1 hypothetical protein SAMN02745912_00218 [Paramaledivibacter caminithermalis DSM 15212]